ncbi:PREDICTED: RNA exonuclease 1 homolog [Papilio polytes]|uniref:RNA exonuclease 1 homolog n=1 Tax=Papilio polytes TaxID=76194 RepID=UPI000676856A|nr:PREDICTED: RNA exonuclease 1 homolog [Papilio polytes]
MLPSTGYFKGLNCPFFDSGLCERPYCHFRHVKKEPQNNDGIESDTILQKLVSAAVQKVLQQTESSGSVSPTGRSTTNEVSKTNIVPVTSKATYNPTPIAELNKINNVDTENNEDANEQRKKHIPVPYTPRKPANMAIKRPVEVNGSFKPFIYIPPPTTYTPGSTEKSQLDPYTPKGTVESKEKYLPGKETELQEYTPNENSTSTKRSYVPSDKNSNKKKILEYKPTKVTSKPEVAKVTYQPTPRSLAPCFSSDEEVEPEEKKRKLSSDLNGLDDLGAEFDILDQILDEEKCENNVKNSSERNTTAKNNKENSEKKDTKSKDDKSDKDRNKSNKSKSDSREKSETQDKQSKSKISSSKDSEKKSSHKSSSKDRDKSDKKHSSKSSKHKSSSSRSSEHHSKNSKYHKEDTKKKEKSHKQKSHKSSKHHKDKHKEKKEEPEDDNFDSHENNEELLEMSESDEESITLECKKIFEEYVPVEKPKVVEDTVNKDDDNEAEEYISSKKRISHTIDKNIKVTPRPQVKPNFKINAAQAMADRMAKIREFHASKTPPNKNEVIQKPPESQQNNVFTPPSSGNTKIRIAHVPYASTLVNAKKGISHTPDNKKSSPSTSCTSIQTVKKGTQRVAHMPNEKFIDRPGVLEPLASKIPANIRSIYLNMMIDECLKIYLSSTDAYARAQHEELATSKKCSTIPIYKNSSVLTVSRLRKEVQECNGVKKSSSECTALQKIPQAISGTTSSAGSWSIENKNKKNVIDKNYFSGAKLYSNIQKWVLTEEQLQSNGFPRPHSSGEKGRAIIYGQKKQNPPKGYIRTCCRCKKDYTVNKKGFPAVKEECIYHPNNKYRVRGEARYQCCSQDATSDGCCIASCHVYEFVDYENLKGYIRTMPPESESDDYGVYSLDCEMCYTTHGLDLTRVTVINSACKVVYETLVKPFYPIIDHNTRYSGITEEQMMGVTTTLLEVQATLLSMFNSKTILIGHSLESDFKALKLIHDTVIDTSVLFPHKMGPPYKRALKNLSSEHLKKIIQNSVDGHDSAEDATVCMELLIFKLKEDLKTR